VTPDFLAALDRDGSDLIAVLASADLSTPVPACPGWALRNLALHQGEVWRWSMRCIEADAYTEQPDPVIADDMLAPWMTEGLAEILTLLRAADPGAPRWTFGPKPRTMAFWPRRMAQEVAVHRWDALDALGRPEPIPHDLAVDGIDEAITVFLPRQILNGRLPEPAVAIEIVVDDTAHRIGKGEPVARVTGDASDILLALWRRIPAERLTIDGDRAAALEILAAPITP
jgi:uncharacterized protein (TIGR03083 family)